MSTFENQTDEDAYFGLAETWDEELYGKLRRDRKIAFGVAGVASLLAAMAIGAVMMLTPLKSVEPYMVLVDKTTGYAESVRELRHNQANSLTENESVVLAEITRYIIARETVDRFDASVRALEIQLSTSSGMYSDYQSQARQRLANMPAGQKRIVTIRSIVPNLGGKSAQVRFSTQVIGNSSASQPQYWIATLTYDFVRLEIPTNLRYNNPLGFLIKEYRVDPETI